MDVDVKIQILIKQRNYLTLQFLLMISKTQTQTTSFKDNTFLESSNDIKGLRGTKSRKKFTFNKKIHEHPKYSSYSSSSQTTSFVKKSIAEGEPVLAKGANEGGQIQHLIQKYLPRGASIEQIVPEMNRILERKDSQMETLRVYRDELKFISFNNPYSSPIKLNLRSLKQKAKVQKKINEQKLQLTRDIKIINQEAQLIDEYLQLIKQNLANEQPNHDLIDIEEEENIMVRNLESATQMLIKELEEEKRKNTKEVRLIQQEILQLRIIIKQKEDKLRDLKARICTMYIKLHSRNRGHANSKSRNLSLSVRKFNKQNFAKIEEIFIGNTTFKNYSREINEKVSQSEQLKKIRVFVTKNELTFQCVYDKKGQGTMHSHHHHMQTESISNTEEYQNPQSMKIHEFQTKYLLSIKIFYKAKIVGIECRMKSEKGNRHLQIGNCSSNLQHELITLVNKKLITLASYWYGKQMIGLSLWSVMKNLVKEEKSAKVLGGRIPTTQVQQQYYS